MQNTLIVGETETCMSSTGCRINPLLDAPPSTAVLSMHRAPCVGTWISKDRSHSSFQVRVEMSSEGKKRASINVLMSCLSLQGKGGMKSCILMLCKNQPSRHPKYAQKLALLTGFRASHWRHKRIRMCAKLERDLCDLCGRFSCDTPLGPWSMKKSYRGLALRPRLPLPDVSSAKKSGACVLLGFLYLEPRIVFPISGRATVLRLVLFVPISASSNSPSGTIVVSAASDRRGVRARAASTHWWTNARRARPPRGSSAPAGARRGARAKTNNNIGFY